MNGFDLHYTQENTNGKLLAWGTAYDVHKNDRRRWRKYQHIITALGGQEVYIEEVDGIIYRWSFDKNLRKTRQYFTN